MARVYRSIETINSVQSYPTQVPSQARYSRKTYIG